MSRQATPRGDSSSATSTTARNSALLALSYDLRLAQAEARAGRDDALVAVLDAAAGETASALEELRELAQGIYPAILSEAGLAPALQTLADEAPLPVELEDVATRTPNTPQSRRRPS